jgi:hypothetical protein
MKHYKLHLRNTLRSMKAGESETFTIDEAERSSITATLCQLDLQEAFTVEKIDKTTTKITRL